MTDIVKRIRKTATCVYLAIEESVAYDISDCLTKAGDEIERLLAMAEKDAKHTGNLEYVLANIRDDVIPDNLEPSDYARASLEAKP